MNKIQYHSNEFFLLRNYPEKRWICTDRQACTQSIGCDCNEYEQKLKACIAAKTKIDNPELLPVVKMETQKGYSYLGGKGVMPLADGSIFDLPDNVEFEERCKLHNIKECEMCSEKVIHLKLKQEVKDESQEQLWNAANWITHGCQYADGYFPNFNELKSKFKIQRINPEQ